MTDYEAIFAHLEAMNGLLADAVDFTHTFSIVCDDAGYDALCQWGGMRVKTRSAMNIKGDRIKGDDLRLYVLDSARLDLGKLEIVATSAPRPPSADEIVEWSKS